MTDESIRKALEVIAHRDIPENTNLWPRLAASLERKSVVAMNPRRKLLWMVLLILVGLFALTGVAYAFHYYFTDPGLQAVSDAGLISDLNSTAQATPLPPATPFGGKPQPATVLGISQTARGVTVILDWVYADQTDLAFGVSVFGLSDDQALGVPIITFPRNKPVETRISSFVLHDIDEGMAGVYSLSYLMRSEGMNGSLAVTVDIPLVSGRGDQKMEVDQFRFDIPDVPFQSVGYAFGQSYSSDVRANGVEMRLDNIMISPVDTQVAVCFEPPSSTDWTVHTANLRLSGQEVMSQLSPAVAYDYIVPLPDSGALSCIEIGFPMGADEVHSIEVSITELSESDGETLSGAWEFQYVSMPQAEDFLRDMTVTAEQPLASENIDGDVTIILEKAYLDVNRMAFVVHIEGPEENYSIYSAQLKGPDGSELNTGVGIGSLQGDPTRLLVEFFPVTEFVAGRFDGQFVVGIMSGLGDSPRMAEAHFDLDLSVYPAIVIDPMQTVTVNGVEMLLQRMKVTPSYTQIYLCYRKPSSRDWMTGSGVSLQVGEDIVSPDSYAMLFDPDYGVDSKTVEPDWTPPANVSRCVKLGFSLGHQDQSESMILIIPELEQSMPESIPDDQLQDARQKLLSQGIDMDWVIWSGQGGGGGGPVINKKPEGMTDEQVMRLFFETLGYYQPGPWTFMVEIKP